MMKSTQDLIEEVLLRLCVQGGFEAFMLFNEEGIPMAAAGQCIHYNDDAIAALTVVLHQSADLLEDFHADAVVNETSIRTSNKYRIVSRPFEADGINLVLIAIVPQRLSYRKITNKAVQAVQHIMNN